MKSYIGILVAVLLSLNFSEQPSPSFRDAMDSVNFDSEMVQPYEFSQELSDPVVLYVYKTTFVTAVSKEKSFRPVLEKVSSTGFLAVEPGVGGEFKFVKKEKGWKDCWIDRYYGDRILEHYERIPTLFDDGFTILNVYIVDELGVGGVPYVCIVTSLGDFIYTEGYLFPAEHFYDFAEYTVSLRNPSPPYTAGEVGLHHSCYAYQYRLEHPLTVEDYQKLISQYVPPEIPEKTEQTDLNLYVDAGRFQGINIYIWIFCVVLVCGAIMTVFLLLKRTKLTESTNDGGKC